MKFNADVISGSGRGGPELGTPTLNLNIEQVPTEMEEGVYACFARMGEHGMRLPATLHYGPRPTFDDVPSCEVHVIDHMIGIPPRTVTADVVKRLRDVRKFDSGEELRAQIEKDSQETRDILCVSC